MKLTVNDLERAAAYLRRYAIAVENKLYMNMSISDAHAAIEEAEHLAHTLDAAAQQLSQINQIN